MLARLSGLAALPAVIAHELVHAALTIPWVDRLAIVVQRDTLSMRVVPDNYHENTPRWAIVVAHLGPTILGGMMGVAAAGYILVTGRIPRTATDWLLAGTLAIWWTIFTTPSESDRTIPTPDAPPVEAES
jgi:hypothetical protein